jgi:hypothetical protein
MGCPNLDDFAEASPIQIVEIPTDNLTCLISQKYFSKTSKGVHLADEIQKPFDGIPVILWP